MTIIIPAECIAGENAQSVNVSGTLKYSITKALGGSVALTVGDDTPVTSKTELRVGDTLTADTTGVENLQDDSGTATTTYQWYRQGTEISGATKSTYTLTADDVGKGIKVRVSRSDAGGTNYKDSDTTAAVQKKVGPAAPTGLKGVAPTDKDGEGTITGLTTDMQYRASSGAGDSADAAVADSEWNDVTIPNMTFASGTYFVRVAATDDTEAGKAATVVVPEYEAPKIDIKDATVTINPQTAIYDGSEQTPAITVMVSSQPLMDNTDYEVSYVVKTTGKGELGSTGKPVGAGTYTVTIKGIGSYEGTVTKEFTIDKADPTCDAPTGLEGKLNERLSTVAITNPTGNTPGTWAWVDDTQTMNTEGKQTFKANFTPTDSANYNTKENIDVEVNVSEAPAETFEVTFDANSGTGTMDKATGVSGDYTLPDCKFTAPTGKKFKGWATSANGEATAAGQTIQITQDTTLYAIWGDVSVTEVTVTFDANEGVLSGDSKMTTTNGKLSKLPTATRSGYTLKGWFTAKTGGDEVTTSTEFSANTTVYAQWTKNSTSGGGTSSGGHSGGYGGGSGGGKSSTTTPTTPATDEKSETTTTTNPDGSITTTVTNPDGSSVETTTYPDGSKLVTETDENGAQTITETRPDGTEIRTEISRRGEVTSKVTLPDGTDEVTVKIPTENRPTAGTVAVIINPDGTREILLDAIIGNDGVTITLDRDATIEIFDNAKSFTDVPSNSWAKEAIDFVTARELFAGVSDTEFGHNSPMTRAMLMTVLARLDGQDTSGGATWYEKGMAWAVAQGISDGTNPNGTITREQLAAMLYRYAGSPATSGNLDIFLDSGRVSPYAVDALRWAVEQGIISGMGDGTLDPQGNATRAQVAAMLMRFMNAMG